MRFGKGSVLGLIVQSGGGGWCVWPIIDVVLSYG